MHSVLLYNGHVQQGYDILMAFYFYFVGLSAGSFVLSSLTNVFGMQRFKSIAKISGVLSVLLLIIAPLFILAYSGQPLRTWFLFVFFNPTAPMSWGAWILTLYPLNGTIYCYFMFKGNDRLKKIFGIIGIPLAILTHAYTGYVVTYAKAKPFGLSSLMPFLFLVSAIVSGIALMMIVAAIKDRFFSKEKKIDQDLLFALAKMLGWAIVLDLFLTFCEVTAHLIGHADSLNTIKIFLMGSFFPIYLITENLIGKFVPMVLLLNKKTRNVTVCLIAACLVVIGIFAMRCGVTLGEEFIPIF